MSWCLVLLLPALRLLLLLSTTPSYVSSSLGRHYNYWCWRAQMDCRRLFLLTCGQRPFRPPSWRFATPWPWACNVMNSHHLREMVETPSLCRQSSASDVETEQQLLLMMKKLQPEAVELFPMEQMEQQRVLAVVDRLSIQMIPLRFDGSNWCWRTDGRRSRVHVGSAAAVCNVRHLPDSDGSIGIERKYPDDDDFDCVGVPHPTRPLDPVGNSNC